MPQPRLSKTVQQMTEAKQHRQDLEPDEQERINALAPTVAIQTNESAATLIAKFTAKGTEADVARAEARRAEARALENGMVAESQSLLTRHGLLQHKYHARVEAAASTDWRALMAAVPEGLYFDTASQRMIPKNHDAIRAYRAATEQARVTLRSTFGDSRPTHDDIDAVNLADAARVVEGAISSGQTHDLVHGVLSASFRRACRVLEFWLNKGRNLVASTEEACARFEKAEAALQQILAAVAPNATVAPAPTRAMLSSVPETPRRAPTSYTDFEPRAIMRDAQPKNDNAPVTTLHEGVHVGRMVERQ